MGLKETVERIEKIEGKKHFHESKFILKNKHLRLYFEAHKTCSRCMLVGTPSYQEVSFMWLNPSYIEDYMTNKFIIDIIMYNRAMRGKQ